ncbi:MAG: PQQ-dependent catabolism-associated CXXCW motif protein, partial [Rubrimonas sp.]
MTGRLPPALALLAALAAPAPAAPPEPDGYRMDDFRAPVPATLAGAAVLDTAAAEALWRDGGAVFIDVLPRAPKPANLGPGVIWRDRPHDSIPGAIWLPNAGYGALHPAMDAWFREALTRATGGDPDRPLVFFCLMDCWMSWNAARRALTEYGHARVYWYPE